LLERKLEESQLQEKLINKLNSIKLTFLGEKIMNLNEVEIEVKHSGLLEVPAGKEVDQLPQAHFQKLIDKKGYKAVIRGLTNLEVWNKNKNPKLSQWASSMADKLKKANKKDESYSQKFQQALDEMNAKTAAKISTNIYRATKSGASKFAKGAGEALKRAGTTAQNAIVAGAAAPIGVKIANSYSKPKKKEQKYSASDVAAIAAALKKNEDLNESLLLDRIKSNIADFAKAESEAYLKAKAIIDRAQREQIDASNTNALNHPILSSIKDGVRIFGHVFIAILLGLAFIALYSRHTGSAKQLFKMVIENVSQNIINDALILIGFTAGFRKVQQLFLKEMLVSERLQYRKSLLEKKESDIKKAAKTVAGTTAAGAGVGGAMGAGIAGGLAHKAATTLGATQRKGAGKLIRRAATGLGGAIGGTYGAATGAVKGLAAGAVLAAGKYAYDKAKAKKKAALKEAVEELKAFTEARSKTAPYAQTLKKHMKGVGEAKKAKEAAKAAKALSKGAQAKEIIKGSTAFKKALDKAAFRGGLKGAALTAGLGAAAYGVHKFRKNNEYNY
jgi:hypothetical protein